MTLPRPPLPGSDRQNGVALLEVLVAILLFSFGILGLIGLQARAISYSTDAEDRNRAAMLANEIATTMWLNNSLSVPEATLATWQLKVANATGSGLTGGVGTVTADATDHSANVLITWRAPNRTETGDSQLVTKVIIP
ncbi:type IV pilus modification protein PilV [Variovorax ginsengisoli]|uniref:Type IV pilus modification protein PilV n=1 Tax=Variovorax ginsengisoli TaxID=363844 RepID=A0ABT8S3W2_9BURK|nr:type IV pilus modification protein PilV [Variovorax ginsengisoli]MDN8614260.1 type IV pilus modification protein PilV [Variovorax ginsengisoli]MDO1533430.1 type IV pilus modification protein PilV [Variovorax ginsengisoli]